jgi:hypothetical protein
MVRERCARRSLAAMVAVDQIDECNCIVLLLLCRSIVRVSLIQEAVMVGRVIS